jgi:glutamate 5-kinase
MKATRLQHLSGVRSAVVKLGSQILCDKEGRLDPAFIGHVAEQVAALQQRGIKVTLVSSGAVAAGLRELNLTKRPTDLAKLQAVASIGQRTLMDAWAGAFKPHDLKVGQVLLTREDIDHRTRFLNLRNTIHAIHELGAIPVINENDTVSTDEIVKITFGDNDILAALVTHALRADLLVLLSVVDGILDAAGNPVRLVESIAAARELVRVEKSGLGKGGMNSKVEAARMVTESGEAMIVANGRSEHILTQILDGESVGTLFVPASRKMSSRNRWIGSARPAGTIVVDDGCARAVTQNNRSLLPAGIVKVDGEFARGDVVAIQGVDGTLLARGLSNYDAATVDQIRGKKTAEVRSLLHEAAYDEVVHRDNLVITGRSGTGNKPSPTSV